jgi:hypothetical protein
MSMGPLGGVVGSAAGAPLSQTAGSDSERVQRDSVAQQRHADASQRAERAAGIGQTEQDQESSERDADGRRPWELSISSDKSKDQPTDPLAPILTRQSKDATGQSGTQLDLTG